jgi:KTSC domain
MSVKKEKINGRMIEVSINSTSLKAASYDTLKENMRVTFTTGKSYEYKNVPSTLFTRFRLAKSQGKFLNENIVKSYTSRKVKSI